MNKDHYKNCTCLECSPDKYGCKEKEDGKLFSLKPQWSNLLSDRCPNCGCRLKLAKYANPMSPLLCSSKKCHFIIKQERFNDLVRGMTKA